MIVTENGWSDTGERNDNGRIDYLRSHLKAVLKARLQDGCNVTGYTHWSIIDNFEWNQGYTYVSLRNLYKPHLCLFIHHNYRKRFGLFHVDFDNDTRTRTAKRSAAAYRDVISTLLFEGYAC